VQQHEEGDISNYKANGEFDLLSFKSVRTVETYSCCPEPYPDITYTISLKRRPMFYVFNLILPCLLINGIGKCFDYLIILYEEIFCSFSNNSLKNFDFLVHFWICNLQ